MSGVVAYRLLGEAIEIDTDGNQLNGKNSLTISGTGGILTTFAQCCHPIPGDPIIAYASPGKGLVIHHESCSNLKKRAENPDHYMPVEWEESDKNIEFEAELRVNMINQQGAFADLTAAITGAHSNIHNIWTEERESRVYQISITLTARNTKHLANIIRKIQTVTGVIDVERNTNG